MDVAERLKKRVSINKIFANEIHHDSYRLNGQYTNNVGWFGKEKIMKNLREVYSDNYIITFGDTSADLPLIENSDLSFSCFSNSTELISKADFNINHLKDAIPIIETTLSE